jgi:hypothetical protein
LYGGLPVDRFSAYPESLEDRRKAETGDFPVFTDQGSIFQQSYE